MSTVTAVSDPDLYAALLEEWEYYDRKPSHVYDDSILYKVYENPSGEIEFLVIQNLGYMDSRSLHNSRPSTYKNLDG